MDKNKIKVSELIEINSSKDKVYQAFLYDISKWWSHPYLMDKDSKGVILEPRVGGLFYEDWGNDTGFKWGEIVHLKKDEIIKIEGTYEWTSAIYSLIEFLFGEENGKTTINVVHTAYGDIGEDTKEGYIKGWKNLIGINLKKFVEQAN